MRSLFSLLLIFISMQHIFCVSLEKISFCHRSEPPVRTYSRSHCGAFVFDNRANIRTAKDILLLKLGDHVSPFGTHFKTQMITRWSKHPSRLSVSLPIEFNSRCRIRHELLKNLILEILRTKFSAIQSDSWHISKQSSPPDDACQFYFQVSSAFQ